MITIIAVCHGIRAQAFNAVRGSAFEKYVKRVGQLAAAEERVPSEISGTQVSSSFFCPTSGSKFIGTFKIIDC